jgi:hypothetical protein
MIGTVLSGELIADPVQRESKAGRRFWTAAIRVCCGDASIIVQSTAFDEAVGARLSKLRKHSAISVSGMLEQSCWVAPDGTDRTGWRVVIAELMTAYEAHQRRQAAAPAPGAAPGRHAHRLWAADDLPGGKL